MENLTTKKKTVPSTDPRIQRLNVIRRALQDPAKLSDDQLKNLSCELFELEYDLYLKPEDK